VLHSASVVLLLLAGATAPAQITGQISDQERANLPKSFHDDALNITYFYPAHFAPVATTPDTSANADTTKCVQTTLRANSAIPAGPSSFVLTSIDDTCPDTLREATSLGPFTRAQILRQLKQYGEPTIDHEPTRYFIDGHSAAITLASVSATSTTPQGARTIYAAKACALGGIPGRRRKKSDPVNPIRRVLCFDFTTQNRDLIDLMFSFIIQFDEDPPQPLFPGSVHPR
jgi:hypothetical protein